MANNSPVYQVLQTNFDRLVNSVKPAVADVARKAFEKNLITSQNLINAQNPMHPEDYRSTTLLLQILGKVKENPTHFDTFVSILKSIPVLRDIGDELSELSSGNVHITSCTMTSKESHIHSSLALPQAFPIRPFKSLHLSHPSQPLLTRYLTVNFQGKHPPLSGHGEVKEKPNNQKNSLSVASESDEARDEASAEDKLSSNLVARNDPFKCPCCSCTLRAYVRGDCPAMEEPNHFPYLDMGRLDSASKINLQTKLFSDTQAMIQKFANLLSSTKKSLKQNNVEPEDIAISALSVSAMGPGSAHVSLLNDHKSRLLGAQRISQVFLTLMPYISFFNHSILKQIITDLGTDEDKQRLEEYLEDFNRFCRHSVFEVPPTVYAQAPDNPEQRKMLAVKLTNASAECTLAHVVSAREIIAKILDLDPASLFLCHIDKGCIRLTFLLPANVEVKLFPMNANKLTALSKVGIRLINPLNTKALSYSTRPQRTVEQTIPKVPHTHTSAEVKVQTSQPAITTLPPNRKFLRIVQDEKHPISIESTVRGCGDDTLYLTSTGCEKETSSQCRMPSKDNNYGLPPYVTIDNEHMKDVARYYIIKVLKKRGHQKIANGLTPIRNPDYEIHQLIDQMAAKVERQVAKEKISFTDDFYRMAINKGNLQKNYDSVTGEVFKYGVHWGKIAAYLVFSSNLAVYCAEHKMEDRVKDVVSWSEREMRTRIHELVQGESVQGDWSVPLLSTVLATGVVITVIIGGIFVVKKTVS